LVAKGLLLGGVGAAGAILMATVVIPLAGLVADPGRHGDLGFGTAGGTIGALAITCAAAVLLALGIGALVRSSALAVAVVVLWPGILELTVARLPGVGEYLAPFLPLGNAILGITGKAYKNVDYLWGQMGGLTYFVCFAVVFLDPGTQYLAGCQPGDDDPLDAASYLLRRGNDRPTQPRAERRPQSLAMTQTRRSRRDEVDRDDHRQEHARHGHRAQHQGRDRQHPDGPHHRWQSGALPQQDSRCRETHQRWQDTVVVECDGRDGDDLQHREGGDGE
jgi:hypothetical protein